MFANPEWFNASSLSALPGPRTNKGWIFYVVCLVGIIVPTVVLVSRGQIVPEAVIWLAVSLLAFFLEVRGLRKELNEREKLGKMHYIDDKAQPPVETERYELELSKPKQA